MLTPPRPCPPQLYTLDAAAVAAEVGLGRRVNMVMQAAFFALSGVVDIKEVGSRGAGYWIGKGQGLHAQAAACAWV